MSVYYKTNAGHGVYDVIIDDHNTVIDVETWLRIVKSESGRNVVIYNDGNEALEYNAIATMAPIQNGSVPYPPKLNENNMIQYPYVDTSKTETGARFIDAGNGEVSILWQSNLYNHSFRIGDNTTNTITLEPGTYTLSGSGVSGIYVGLYGRRGSSQYEVVRASDTDITFSISSTIVCYATIYMRTWEYPLSGDCTILPLLRKYYDDDGIFPISGYDQVTLYINSSPPVSDVVFPNNPGTVYSGTFNFRKGILTVDGTLLTFNGTEEGWIHHGTTSQYCSIFDLNIKSAGLQPYNGMGNFKGICNMFSVGGGAIRSMSHGDFWYSGNGETIRFGYGMPENQTSIEEWKELISAYNIQVYAPIANPKVYRLDPQTIGTLGVGMNNVYTNTDNVKVIYYMPNE